RCGEPRTPLEELLSRWTLATGNLDPFPRSRGKVAAAGRGQRRRCAIAIQPAFPSKASLTERLQWPTMVRAPIRPHPPSAPSPANGGREAMRASRSSARTEARQLALGGVDPFLFLFLVVARRVLRARQHVAEYGARIAELSALFEQRAVAETR